MSKTETQITCRTTWVFKNRLEAQAAREGRLVPTLIRREMEEYLDSVEPKAEQPSQED